MASMGTVDRPRSSCACYVCVCACVSVCVMGGGRHPVRTDFYFKVLNLSEEKKIVNSSVLVPLISKELLRDT